MDISKFRRENVISFINLILSAATLNLLSRNFGCYSYDLMKILAFYLMLAFLVFNVYILRPIPKSMIKRPIFSIFSLSSIILSFVLLCVIKDIFLWPFSLVSLQFGVYCLSFVGKERQIEIEPIFLTSMIYSMIFYVIYTFPPFWHIVRIFSYGLTDKLTYLASSHMILGPSNSCIILILPFFIYYSLIFRKKKPLLMSILISFLAWFAYIEIYSAANSGYLNTYPDKMMFQYVAFLLQLLASFIIIFFIHPDNKEEYLMERYVKVPPKFSRYIMPVSIILLLVFSCIYFPFYYHRGGVVSVYRANMLGDWDKPNYFRFGEHARGMFGFLPDFLYASGCSVNMINGTLTKNDLIGTDVLIIINLGKELDQSEKEVIWDFVRNGGSLFVLGDHTNVGGIMFPLNDLLKEVGIAFRFDSAHPASNNWKGRIDFYNHPLSKDLDRDLTGWSIGASLDTPLTSIPVIIGRYSFSDHGNMLNAEGAYLGDYLLNEDEESGDLILAAATFYGGGKVLVFGDTSSIQNTAIAGSHKLFYQSMLWLLGGDNQNLYYLRLLSSASLFIISVLFILYLPLYRKKDFIMITSMLLIVFLLFVNNYNRISIGEEILEGKIAYIDASHSEKFNLVAFSEGSLTGFSASLMRNGYIPIIRKDFSVDQIEKSRIFVSVGPLRCFSEGEAKFIKEFMEKGGLVILSVGYTDRISVEKILQYTDMDIINMPLGSVPYTTNKNVTSFVNAYPIDVKDQNKVITIYSVKMNDDVYHIVAFERLGLGGMLLIADPNFLFDKNLEHIFEYHIGNIMFLKGVFEELREGGILI